MQSRAIAEGRLKHGNERYTVQIVKPITSVNDQGLYNFYIFNGGDPREGAIIKNIPLGQINALMWYFRKDATNITRLLSKYKGGEVELDALISNGLQYDKELKLVKLHPSYEPVISPTIVKSNVVFMKS